MSPAALQAETVRPDIAELVADVFQYDSPLTHTTSPNEIERWDSLKHIELIKALEDDFEISMTMDEMMEIRCVGDIERVLERYGV
ncbi:MAG: acyl carrier protein [Alphaproteobacteria bacterium]|nr:acyl carrier protein [Alphaproteobacteria bacterium]